MEDRLNVLWTSGDVVTAEKMVFMYTHNAKLLGWWDEVTLVIWGASTKLASENKQVQNKLKEMVDTGVNVEACKACADQLGASEVLESIGVDVKYWGEPLTKILKESGTLLTI